MASRDEHIRRDRELVTTRRGDQRCVVTDPEYAVTRLMCEIPVDQFELGDQRALEPL
jgi:hypothetical protein